MTSAWKLLSFIMVLMSPGARDAASQPHAAPTFPPHGGAFVTTLPAGASAWLDGEYVGQTPMYVDDLLPGRHSITISRSGWQPLSASFDVFVGRVTPVSVAMQRTVQPRGVPSALAKGQGTLMVRGGPPGAKLYIDGAGIGTMPLDSRGLEAGFHIVMLEPSGKNSVKETRIVDVFPDTTTVIEFSAPVANDAQPNAGEDILVSLDSVVPSSGVIIAGNDVSIHYRGVEVECSIGSRSFKLNGKAGTLSVPPALVGGKVYVPQSLAQRLVGK